MEDRTVNNTHEKLEMKALLASTGEVRLTADEQALTAEWRRGLDHLTAGARDALAGAGSPAYTLQDLRPATRAAVARQRFRAGRRRLVRRLAAAASLALLIGSGMHLQIVRAEQTKLERLVSVLLLFEDPEEAIDFSLIDQTPATLKTLAAHLSRLQFASN